MSDYISLILLYKDLLHDQLLMGTRRKNACLSCLRCYKMFKFVQNTNVLFKKKCNEEEPAIKLSYEVLFIRLDANKNSFQQLVLMEQSRS